MGGGGQGGDNKDEKDKKVQKHYRINSFFLLTTSLIEGQAQVRAPSTTNNENRPKEA
jgi:hypothetical protein